MVKLQDELDVGPVPLGRLLRRLGAVHREAAGLPLLAFVFTEVLHDERPHVGDAQQPFARGVDGEAAQVAGDPTAIQLLRDRRRGAGAGKAIENKVAFVGRRFDDALEQGFGLLRGVACSFQRDIVHQLDVSPNVLKWKPFDLVFKSF